MPTTIKLRNSVTTTSAPSSLVQGEVAINITDKKVWVGNAATTPIQLLGDGGSASFTAISLSGNLNFTSTGNRIRGDFSDANPANRVNFQTSVTNGNTTVDIIPNGTATISQIAVWNNSNTTNAGVGVLSVTSSAVILGAGISGSGSYVPIIFTTGAAERLRIDTSGNVSIGTSTAGRTLTVAPIPFAAGNLGGIRLINTSNNTSSIFEMLYGLEAGTGIPFGSLRTGNDGNSYITFFTGAGPTERMRIDASGNVGIGVSPNTKLDVLVGSNQRLLFTERGTGGSVIDSVNAANSSYAQFLLNGSTLIFATGATERMRVRDDGAVLIGTTTSLATLTVNGNISPVQAPTSNWGIDFTPSTSSGTYVTIANDATYDIAFGSGYVFIWDDTGLGVSQIACYYGTTTILFQNSTLYNVTPNNAGTINVYYNAANARYRIQNKTGASRVVWISTLRFRANV